MAVTLYEKVVRETTKPPTGITITRDGNKFKVTWKIGDKNYGGGQRLWWQTNNGFGAEYKLGSKVTSKTITVDFSKHNPPTGKKLEYIEVFILGLRSNYTTTTNKRKVTHKMDWSLDAEKTYTLNIPNKPKLTAELDDEIDNRCKFSWETVTSNTAKRVFTDVQWQSKLLKNSTITDGEKAFAATGVANTYESGTGTANSSKTITEDNTYINGDNSYTRWFRVRARGPAGVTGWVYRKHVYAKPNAAGNISASAVKQNNGYMVTVEWTSAKNASRPIDSMIVQYAAVVPAAGITVPPAASWTDAATVAYKDGTDKAKFLFADELDDDQVLFVRVTTKHDHEANDVASDTAIALVGALALPTLSNVVTVPETHRATITATNNSAVSDSFLVIAYKQSSNPGNVMFLGVITGSSTSATVQCPDWGDDDISFGVYAAVGNYDAQTGDDGVALYDIYPYDDRPLMTSEGVWDNGQVPKAPDNVAVTRTNTQGTVRVTWENTWDAADGVELTWSDHADAWESTDQPSSFIVSNVYTAGWCISNLDVGKTWYIRVRLVSGSGEDGTPGPWSEIIPKELAESPNVPVLELSQPAIPEFGTVTASWGYVSKDGTPQAYAEICEATITAQGVTYGDVIARVTTPQHVDINAEEVGWAINNTYLLCVRVGSASGQDSEWSDPVPIEIVPPLNIAITETSLADYHVVSTEADTTPYLFRPSPALTEDYDRLLLDKVVGGTLAVNQLMTDIGLGGASSGITTTAMADGGAKLNGTTSNTFFRITGWNVPFTGNHVYLPICNTDIGILKVWNATRQIYKATQDISNAIAFYDVTNGRTFTDYVVYPMLFDLTQMFGSTIADYVYNLEQSTAGSGVAWLKQYYPSIFNSYLPYNAGTLESVEASAHVMTGFNQWDEEAESGFIDVGTGANTPSDARYRSKNYIKILPNTNYYFKSPAHAEANNVAHRFYYYDENKNFITSPQSTTHLSEVFTTPSNAFYMRFFVNEALSNYNDDICVNISSSRNGEYEAYTQTSYPLDSTLTLRGVPKLDNGVPYYDGDIYESDGSVNRRYGVYTFTGNEPETSVYSVDVMDTKSRIVYVGLRNVAKAGSYLPIVSDKYVSEASSSPEIGRATMNNSILNIGVPNTVTTKAEAIAYLAGVTFIYELATPTTETADPYTNPQVCYKGGTEEFVSGNVIPVGHETEYAKAYDFPTLTDMPLTVTVTGAGETGETTVAIERAQSYYLDRPDERNFAGHEGETIALVSQTGETLISIDNEDLIGTLDDGAPYRIVATISDGFGQSAEASIDFEVHWDHQAVFPTATVEADNDNYVSYITPIQPQGYAEGDTVDIYRLSVDRPELIYSGAEFGTTYVDPFPALGEMGGHRIVYRTANGDYITEDNEIAWTDYRAEDGDGIDTMYNIINFGTGQVQLMYDITLNSGWDKDFQETKYLGGHIQGDWNNATSRSGSIGGSLVVTQDQETIQALRRLGDYPGICHVRTRDGSSYAADVQVSESRDMGKDVIRSEFTLTITRVDPEGFDGMTYEDWESENESEQ